jgi:hypothetical protein
MVDLAVIVPLATGALAAVSAAVAKLYQSLVTQPRLDCQEAKAALVMDKLQLEAELKAERKEHWKTAMALERLLGKYERERGSGSPPPSR